MPLAVVALDFDPTLRLGGWVVRLETAVIALGVLFALLVAALVARATPASSASGAADDDRLRLDDLLFVALSAIPGAVIGGRVGYVLLHLDYYRANASAIVDPGQGSLELAFAVAGAAITGGYAARLLTGAAGPWLHVAAVPTLIGLGIGKLAMALGGSGQGAPSDVAWATAYVGPGSWGSLGPGVAAHPAQLYEAAAIGVVVLALVALLSTDAFEDRDGRAWLFAAGGWLLGRVIVAATWRDAAVLGPLNAAQLLSLAVLAGCAIAAYLLRHPRRVRRVGTTAEPRWPDPETRPPF